MSTSQTTAAFLTATANARAGRFCYVVLFEGVGLAFTTSEDLSGIAAAWAGTSWAQGTGNPTAPGTKSDASTTAVWYQTAFYPGEVEQQIEFFNPQIHVGSLSFKVLDRDDSLAATVFGQNRQSARTFLRSDLDPGRTTGVVVQETGAFSSAPGQYALYIGNEALAVDGSNKAGSSWLYASRGLWSFHQTSAGERFSPAHRINQVNGAAPRVTTAPTTWYNRKIRVFLHHYEVGKGWSDSTQAMIVWEGCLRNVTDNGDRSLTFNSVHVTSLLQTNIFETQFTARVAEGMFIPVNSSRVIIREVIAGTTFTEYKTNFTGDQLYTARALMDALTALLRTGVSALGLNWTVDRMQDGKVRWQVTSDPAAGTTSVAASQYKLEVGLSNVAWNLLGYAARYGDGRYYTDEQPSASYNQVMLTVPFRGTAGSPSVATWELAADDLPVQYDFPRDDFRGSTVQFKLEGAQGTWVTQPILSTGYKAPTGTQGYLQIGDSVIVGGSYDSGTTTFTVTWLVTDQFTPLGFSGTGTTIAPFTGQIREGKMGEIKVCQVWYETAGLKDIMLRLLLSTGRSGYNSATWDVNPAGLGAAVPYDLLDVPSFLALGSDFWTLLLNKPVDLMRVLTSALASTGMYLVWRQGVLTLVEPKLDGPTIAMAYTLTNDNKARVDDRVRAEHATDGVVNRIELKFDRAYDGSFKSTVIFEDVVSSSDFGARRGVSIEGWGIQNFGSGVLTFKDKVASKALAFFSRPMTIVERTINKTIMQIEPGDTVLLSDPYLINPKTGVRGLSNWPAWVVEKSFDYSKMVGKVRLAFNGETAVDKICPWGPSARVNAAAANAGYVVVDASNRYLDITGSTYSDTTVSALDVGAWTAGDKIIVRELSPTDQRNPLLFHCTVASVDAANQRLYLTATISSWDTTKKYIVTSDVITTVQQSQLGAGSFVADDATDTTGRLANDSYVWGTPRKAGTQASAVTTTQYTKPATDGSSDGKGSALSVADIAEAFVSLNCVRAYKTRHMTWQQLWTGSLAPVTSTANRELIAGPIWCPLYRAGARGLIVNLYVSTTGGTATFTATFSRSMPAGSVASQAVVFKDPQATLGSIQLTTNSATPVWVQSVGSVAVYPDTGGEPQGVWMSVEASTGNAAFSAKLWGASVYEANG